MQTLIKEVDPATGTLIAHMYEVADYRDAFLVSTNGRFPAVDDFAKDYFLCQPRWLSLLSMNLATRERLLAALTDADFSVGSAVGSWKVHARSVDEIVFGDDMGFMEYRFSMLRRPNGDIEASTAVKYRWRRASRIYFGVVKPMHRRFVPRSLNGPLSTHRVQAFA